MQEDICVFSLPLRFSLVQIVYRLTKALLCPPKCKHMKNINFSQIYLLYNHQIPGFLLKKKPLLDVSGKIWAIGGKPN